MSPFRDRLKEAAKYAGVEYSQTAIAESLGISKQTVDQWMANGRPSAEMIYLIADTWNVDPRWLQIEQGEMIPALDTKLNQNKNKTKEQQISDAEKLLILVRTFLDTDSEARRELMDAVTSVMRAHDDRATQSRRIKRR